MIQTRLQKIIRKLVRKFSVSRYALILVLLSLLPAQADGPSEASGGVYFIMAPRINEAHEAYFDILWPKVRDTLRASRDIVGTVRREKRLNGNLYVQISDPDGARHAWEKVSDLLAAESELLNFSNVKFDVSIENTLLTITFQEATSGQISEQIISQTIEVLRDRMVEFEIYDVQVTAYGSQFIQVLAFDIASKDEILALLGNPASLVVSPVIGKTRDSQITVSRGSKLLRDRHDKSTFFVIDGLILLTNQEFREFESAFDLNGRPVINFRLSEAGTHVLDVHIKNEPNGIVAFVLDGEVVSVMMNSRVRIPSNKGTIIGEFTLDEADRLTRLLNVGSLPFGLDLVQHREISPPLSINQ